MSLLFHLERALPKIPLTKFEEFPTSQNILIVTDRETPCIGKFSKYQTNNFSEECENYP